jgi:hypothetical protein
MSGEERACEGLGEEIGSVVQRGDFEYKYNPHGFGLADVMILDIDVLGTVVVDRIVDEIDRPLVVLVNRRSTRAHTLQEGTQLAEV